MKNPEVWLRGPLPEYPSLLQPVAHGLLQCREEVDEALRGLTREELRARPGGAASASYHVRHAIGSLDRLLTYARGEQLSPAQLDALAAERDDAADSADRLASDFGAAIAGALAQLRRTDPDTLLESRRVGRAQLPSTVLGLLVHAAEHTQRHVGQLVTTVKVARAGATDARA